MVRFLNTASIVVVLMQVIKLWLTYSFAKHHSTGVLIKEFMFQLNQSSTPLQDASTNLSTQGSLYVLTMY